MFHTFRCCLLASIVLSLIVCCGCSGGPGYKVVPLEGTITYKGQPLESITLSFAVGDYRVSGAYVDTGGKFTAIHSPEHLGVPVGKCKMTITWGGRDGTNPPPEYSELFAKYGPSTEGYTFEVTKADKKFKIDLE